MTARKIEGLFYTFRFPLFVLLSIILALLIQYVFTLPGIAKLVLLAVVLSGAIPLFVENLRALIGGRYALDYIALLAILVGLLSGQYLVAAVIVLMLAGGNTLEEYGTSQAKESLTALTDRIPNAAVIWNDGQMEEKIPVDEVKIGMKIFVRKGEVIPLDGVLVSDTGYTDESSLTGEPYMIDKVQGDRLRSGTVNVGDGIVITVSKASTDSTYHKIIEMVRVAQQEKAPLIRLADRYSTVFTLITLILAGLAYAISHDFERVLSVLVIATPCPLILATPIALMGGMNAAAKRRIIMKRLSSVEVLSRVNTIIFDKTGTITLGKPSVEKLTIIDTSYTTQEVFGIAEAIERNSLHPLAKAIVQAAHERQYEKKFAKNVTEKIGIGIEGEVEGVTYRLSKATDVQMMAISLSIGERRIGLFTLEDKIKNHSKKIINQLQKLGLELYLFTGDKKEAAQRVALQLGGMITVRSECSPEDKREGIENLKRQRKVTAMIGDGINDAPALAAAHVGLVFSNEEQTASSEAADVIFLGGDFSSVMDVVSLSKRTIHIAMQSIFVGIGLSILGMLLATFGYIVPITGAFVQETIDVLVILNALRSSRLR